VFNIRSTFVVGFIGGIAGYACSSYMQPSPAGAQTNDGLGGPGGGESTVADAGVEPSPSNPPPANPPPTNPPPTNPAATTTPASGRCLQWEVKIGPKISNAGAVNTLPVLLEEGWEPFVMAPSPNSNFYIDAVVLRRCVK
jgi:hypothetical protein